MEVVRLPRPGWCVAGTERARHRMPLEVSGKRRMVSARSLIARPIASLSLFGGVPDSTLGWSAPLPVESRGSLVKSPATKIIGTYEEMPMAA